MYPALSGKVALVTGASRGIGQAIAETLAANGAKVVVNYAHQQQQADKIVHCIEHNGGQARAVQADVGKPKDLETLFRTTLEEFGRVDILVNNAGRSPSMPSRPARSKRTCLHLTNRQNRSSASRT